MASGRNYSYARQLWGGGRKVRSSRSLYLASWRLAGIDIRCFWGRRSLKPCSRNALMRLSGSLGRYADFWIKPRCSLGPVQRMRCVGMTKRTRRPQDNSPFNSRIERCRCYAGGVTRRRSRSRRSTRAFSSRHQLSSNIAMALEWHFESEETLRR